METSHDLPVAADPAEPREGVPVDVEGPPVGGSCELHVVLAVLQLCVQIGLLRAEQQPPVRGARTERAGALSALDSRFTVERGWVTLLCQSQVYSKVTPLHARTHYSFSDSFPTLGVTGL